MNMIPRAFSPINTYGLYLPENLELSSILPPKLQPYGAYFVSRVLWGKATWQADPKGFVSLKAEYLRKVVPKLLLPVVKKALLEAGVLETDGYYIENEKCFGYRLGPAYRNMPVRRIPCPCPKLARKAIALREEPVRRLKNPVYKWLSRQFENLEIDISQAEYICQDIAPENRIAVQAIANKEYEFSVCQYGRVHTNLTRLARQLRPALRCQQEALVNIDIRNSQPLFLALLYSNFLKEQMPYRCFKKKNKRRFNPDETSSNEEENFYTYPTPAITMSNLLERITGYRFTAIEADAPFLPEDAQEYLSLCEQGRLYDDLMDIMGRHDRDAFKTDFYRDVFFGSNHGKSELKDLFRDQFPTIMQFVKDMKRKNYAMLSHRMQKDESRFMITTVCERLRREMPEAPVYTIHDSIMTTRQYVEPITRIMKQEFACLGITPSLKTEEY